jgi:hypothetical protein
MRGLAREGEERGGERPESLSKPRHFTGATQQAHRRSCAHGCRKAGSPSSESKIAYAGFRPAQQKDQQAADRSGAADKAFGDGRKRDQDDGETPKRVVVLSVLHMPIHCIARFRAATIA